MGKKRKGKGLWEEKEVSREKGTRGGEQGGGCEGREGRKGGDVGKWRKKEIKGEKGNEEGNERKRGKEDGKMT